MKEGILVTCEEAKQTLHFHLDGDDHHPHVKNAHHHRVTCAHCAAHLDQLKEVERGLRSMAQLSAPSSLHERIMKRVQTAIQKRPLYGTVDRGKLM
ncbi:hypothetical protein ATW55_13375 [Ferroacidibacillus organovorans]|uniref:Anti-sigma factor n=1 Tax=Ferroacidibacillus organovorans TaxID=1765683 RepID=A0A101XPE6_9BACL|nr:hypothetical protein ATW55_13375 [Ferroacidibacillus organovorans]